MFYKDKHDNDLNLGERMNSEFKSDDGPTLEQKSLFENDKPVLKEGYGADFVATYFKEIARKPFLITKRSSLS